MIRTALQDLQPSSIEDFHKLAFQHGYVVRWRDTKGLGRHYAALDEEGGKLMGIYPMQGNTQAPIGPMLLIVAPIPGPFGVTRSTHWS